MTLEISVHIGAVGTELMTDQELSFDAIETLLTRVVRSSLDAYTSLSDADKDRVLDFESLDDDDDE
jgi:hypothetical protein